MWRGICIIDAFIYLYLLYLWVGNTLYLFSCTYTHVHVYVKWRLLLIWLSLSRFITFFFLEPPRISFPDHRAVPAPGFCDSQLDKPFVSEDVGVGVCVSPGSTVLIDCEINGNPRPMPTVQWLYNGTSYLLINIMNIHSTLPYYTGL